MNQIAKVFQYQGANVRTVIKDGEPWFVLVDLCKALGLSHAPAVKKRIPENMTQMTPISDSMGRNQQNTTIVNESGLYEVVLESRKPEAVDFRRWITEEVLPEIRKTGTYSIGSDENKPDVMVSLDFVTERRSGIRPTDSLTTKSHVRWTPEEDETLHEIIRSTPEIDEAIQNASDRLGRSTASCRSRIYIKKTGLQHLVRENEHLREVNAQLNQELDKYKRLYDELQRDYDLLASVIEKARKNILVGGEKGLVFSMEANGNLERVATSV